MSLLVYFMNINLKSAIYVFLADYFKIPTRQCMAFIRQEETCEVKCSDLNFLIRKSQRCNFMLFYYLFITRMNAQKISLITILQENMHFLIFAVVKK